MKRSYGSLGAILAAVLVGGFLPAPAAADDLDHLADAADIADQVQAEVWSGDGASPSAAAAAQATTAAVTQTVERVTHEALGTATSAVPATTAGEATRALAGASPAVTATAAAAAPGAPRPAARAATTPRGRGGVRARREAAVRTSAPEREAIGSSSSPSWQAVSPAAQAPARPRASAQRETGAKSTRSRGGGARTHAPPAPWRLPPLPPPSETASSSAAGVGSGLLLPPLLVALTAVFGIFVFGALARRVPARRVPTPRRIFLPPWRPG